MTFIIWHLFGPEILLNRKYLDTLLFTTKYVPPTKKCVVI